MIIRLIFLDCDMYLGWALDSRTAGRRWWRHNLSRTVVVDDNGSGRSSHGCHSSAGRHCHHIGTATAAAVVDPVEHWRRTAIAARFFVLEIFNHGRHVARTCSVDGRVRPIGGRRQFAGRHDLIVARKFWHLFSTKKNGTHLLIYYTQIWADKKKER